MSASIVLAVNQKFCVPLVNRWRMGDRDGVFTSGERRARIRTFLRLTREPIDAAALARKILKGEDGAIVTFEGVTRNNTKGRATRYLEYECYEPMAVKTMAEIGGEIARARIRSAASRWFIGWGGWRLAKPAWW